MNQKKGKELAKNSFCEVHHFHLAVEAIPSIDIGADRARVAEYLSDGGDVRAHADSHRYHRVAAAMESDIHVRYSCLLADATGCLNLKKSGSSAI